MTTPPSDSPRQQDLSHGILECLEFRYLPSEFARRCLLYRISTGHIYSTKDYLVQRKRWDSYLLLYVLFGQIAFETSKRTYYVNEGEAVLLNCYTQHLYRATTESDFYWTHFDGNGAARIFSCLSSSDSARVIKAKRAAGIAQFLTLSFYNAPILNMTEAEYSGQLYNLLMSLMDGEMERRAVSKIHLPASDFVNIVDSFIHDCYKDDISLADIARYAAVSESYLGKEYKAATGVTPYTALLRYRISVACKLLRTTNMSIGEIAESCGYHSLANFTFGFNREMGMPPSEYRAQNRSLT